MLSLEDCLALCELTEEEVLAIAQHEHIPEIAARARGHRARERALERVMRNFVLQHPRCEERHCQRFDEDQRAGARTA
jgi:hypothetical protein